MVTLDEHGGWLSVPKTIGSTTGSITSVLSFELK